MVSRYEFPSVYLVSLDWVLQLYLGMAVFPAVLGYYVRHSRSLNGRRCTLLV
jgi:hypothetical protein